MIIGSLAMNDPSSDATIRLSNRALLGLIIALVASVGGGNAITNVLIRQESAAELERRISTIERRLDQMDERSSATAERLSRIETKLDYIIEQRSKRK